MFWVLNILLKVFWNRILSFIFLISSFFRLLDIIFEVKAYKTCATDTIQQSSPSKRKNVRTKVVETIKSSSKVTLPSSFPSPIGQKNDNGYSTNTCQIGNLPGSYPRLNQIQDQISSQKNLIYSKTSQRQFDNHSITGNSQVFKGRITM